MCGTSPKVLFMYICSMRSIIQYGLLNSTANLNPIQTMALTYSPQTLNLTIPMHSLITRGVAYSEGWFFYPETQLLGLFVNRITLIGIVTQLSLKLLFVTRMNNPNLTWIICHSNHRHPHRRSRNHHGHSRSNQLLQSIAIHLPELGSILAAFHSLLTWAVTE